MIDNDSGTRSGALLLHPIGIVCNQVATRDERRWEDVVSEIRINEDCAEGLHGIEGFSHVIVIYWMHCLNERERGLLKVHPQRNEAFPLEGVFATRSPARPNPLGISVVRLLSREGRTLMVSGLDALDNSPVIDIKPYLPNGDSVPLATVAGWLKRK
ncbi:MAG: tRNA (N6-threonylcarbamoyladenosine(37)-N6)-methyltransferase TrmO [Dehalococcoidia bacterium]|nr:tRNA (N6-threonylcarbamoyladenosine(37)-N6)-methyltransferase TrmO [Dehalococcoidia bacterium]